MQQIFKRDNEVIPSEMELQKAQISVPDSERTPTAIGYGILLLQIL